MDISLVLVLALALAWLAILAGVCLGWQLLRQNGRLLLRVEELETRLNELQFAEGDETAGLPVGTEAPDFELPDLAGHTRTLAEFRGSSVLLVFFNPACGYCRDVAPKLAAIQKPHPPSDGSAGERPTLPLLITTGDPETNRLLLEECQLACPALLQNEMEVAAVYRANGTPSGYLVSPEGRISSRLAIGAEALLELAREPRDPQRETGTLFVSQPSNSSDQPQADGRAVGATGDARALASRFANRSLARSKINRDGLKAGTPAPDFRLPRLDGRGDLALSDLRGRTVLLVFSSPACGPCHTLAPHLEACHRQHPELEIVMVSKGEPKENRAKVREHGLTFPIVLQQQWEISRRYALFATPVAYLINQQGIIAADPAVGADPIIDLLRAHAGRAQPITPTEPAIPTPVPTYS